MNLNSNQYYIINPIKLNTLHNTQPHQTPLYQLNTIHNHQSCNFVQNSSIGKHNDSGYESQYIGQEENSGFYQIRVEDRGSIDERYEKLFVMDQIIGRKIKQYKTVLFFNLVSNYLQIFQKQQQQYRAGVKDLIAILQPNDNSNISYKQKQPYHILQKYSKNQRKKLAFNQQIRYDNQDQYAPYLTKITQNDEENSQVHQKNTQFQDHNFRHFQNESTENKKIFEFHQTFTVSANLSKHNSCQNFSGKVSQTSTHAHKTAETINMTKPLKKRKNSQQIYEVDPLIIKMQKCIKSKLQINLQQQGFDLWKNKQGIEENITPLLLPLSCLQQLKVDSSDRLNIVQMGNYPPVSASNVSLSINCTNYAYITASGTPRSSISYSSAKKHNISLISQIKKNIQQPSSISKSIHGSSASKYDRYYNNSSSNFNKSFYKQKQDEEKEYEQKLKLIRRYTFSHQNSPTKYYTKPNHQYKQMQFEDQQCTRIQQQNIRIKNQKSISYSNTSKKQNKGISGSNQDNNNSRNQDRSNKSQLFFGSEAINFKNQLIQQRQGARDEQFNLNSQFIGINRDCNSSLSNSNININKNIKFDIESIDKQKIKERKSTPTQHYHTISGPVVNKNISIHRNNKIQNQQVQTNRKTIKISKNKNFIQHPHQLPGSGITASFQNYQTIFPNTSSISKSKIKPYQMNHNPTQRANNFISYNTNQQIYSQNRLSLNPPNTATNSYIEITPISKQNSYSSHSTSYQNLNPTQKFSQKLKTKNTIDITQLTNKYLEQNDTMINKSKYQQSSSQFNYLEVKNDSQQMNKNKKQEKNKNQCENQNNIATIRKLVEPIQLLVNSTTNISLYLESLKKQEPISIDKQYTNYNIYDIMSKYQKQKIKQQLSIRLTPDLQRKTTNNQQKPISSQIKQSISSTNFKTHKNHINYANQQYINFKNAKDQTKHLSNNNLNINTHPTTDPDKNNYSFTKIKSNSFNCNPCQYQLEQQNQGQYMLQINKIRKQRQRYYMNMNNYPNNISIKQPNRNQKAVNINRLNNTTFNYSNYPPNISSNNRQRLSLSISQGYDKKQHSGGQKKIQPSTMGMDMNKNQNIKITSFEMDSINLGKMEIVQSSLREKNLQYVYNKNKSNNYQKQKQKDNNKQRQIFYSNLRNKNKIIEREKQKEKDKNKIKDKNYANLMQSYEENSYKRYIPNHHLTININRLL